MTRRKPARWRPTHRAEIHFVGDANPTVVDLQVDAAGMGWGEHDRAPMLQRRGATWHLLAGVTLQSEPRVRRLQPEERWPQSALSKLGNVSDSVISEDVGCTVEAVRQKRERLGIPACDATPGPKPQRGATAASRISVRVTAEERAAFAAAAGKEPISEWGRKLWRRAARLDP